MESASLQPKAIIRVAAAMFGSLALALGGCVESEFELDSSSRLPKWFSAAANSDRGSLVVTLRYFTGLEAELELRDKSGERTMVVRGKSCWHPIMEGTHQYGVGFNTPSRYTYVVAHQITEVIEHRGEPRFRISEDPALIKAAQESTVCRQAP